MKSSILSKPFKSILVIYLICFAVRIIEYMILRTDQSIFGEAFLHKLFGIGLLVFLVKSVLLPWHEIGVRSHQALKHISYGLAFGLSVFSVAYGVEYFVQRSAGNAPSLQIYVSSFSTTGNIGQETAFLFFVFCIIGNIINVIMEEGIFRGLFVKLYEKKHTFMQAAIFSSVLFGLWHIISPLRSLFDGDLNPQGMMLSATMLVVTSGLVGLKLCLLTKITGSLWMPMADHFVNNAIVNLLHIVTSTGNDELIFIRISIAQTLSFLIVLALYWKSASSAKQTFRM